MFETELQMQKEFIIYINDIKKDNIILEENNKFIICDNFKFLNLKFTAYELKLKQWKKTILQDIKNKLKSLLISYDEKFNSLILDDKC